MWKVWTYECMWGCGVYVLFMCFVGVWVYEYMDDVWVVGVIYYVLCCVGVLIV